MNYFVFEAGSRAGFSAEMFFLAYRKQRGLRDDEQGEDNLILVDSDDVVNSIPHKCCAIHRVSESTAKQLLCELDDVLIFPADELTRQCNDEIREIASRNPISEVSPVWYDKMAVNCVLNDFVKEKRSPIHIPRTFELTSVFIKPDKASAGSKGLYSYDNVCVSARINIKRELVVDVIRDTTGMMVFPREVKLRSGYDRLIKLLDPYGALAQNVKEFIEIVSPFGVFAPGIFHLQIAEDIYGDLYYIESSRRISGTSIVNLGNGFNPFCLLNGIEADSLVHKCKYDQWFRYEDFILDIENIIRSLI